MKLKKDQKTTSFLTENVELRGNLHTSGAIRIDGPFSGKMFSSSVVYVGEKSYIRADIVANTIVSSGTIHGNITTDESVMINNPGSVEGKIVTEPSTLPETIEKESGENATVFTMDVLPSRSIICFPLSAFQTRTV